MLQMIATVVAVRFGTMENEATKETFKWAKVMTIEDDIEESNGFIGQRVVEYSVPAESVDLVVANAKHDHTVPSPCNLDFSVSMSGGKATLKCVGLKKLQAK
jgi:peptidyl-tRNA hydrolase